MAIKDIILYGAYQDFPKEGVRFIDLTPSISDIKVRNRIIEEIIKLYNFDDIDYVISPDARGFIWGGMVSERTNKGFIPVRKPGKLPEKAIKSSATYETEYSKNTLNMPLVDIKGKKLVFIDDVYATGGTYRAVEQLVKDNGGLLLGGAVILDIEIIKNKEIKSLITSRDLK